MATDWSESTGAVLLCGRYEGIDQRFIDACVDRQISLGDFVLSGGEIAAIALLDAVARLMPGVLSDEGSHQQDSFNPALNGLLDSPHHTRQKSGRAHMVRLACRRSCWVGTMSASPATAANRALHYRKPCGLSSWKWLAQPGS